MAENSAKPGETHQLSDLERVRIYHDATKHHPHRYARSLGYLDWANQPDPFRRYAGADLIELTIGPIAGEPRYEQLFAAGRLPPQPINRRTLSAFFECSLGLSAWKQYRESTWALRCNPSSGNLHPTEGYLVCGAIEQLSDAPSVYHYAPRIHALERRHQIPPPAWTRLCATASRSETGAFLVGLSSILWREAWKYGERAFRYCQHDVGHALGCIRFAAAMLGWRMRLLDHLADDDVSALLGLDHPEDFVGAEREEPELLAIVWPNNEPPPRFDAARIPDAAAGQWHGRANALSKEHVQWDIIDMAAGSTRKPRSIAFETAPAQIETSALPPIPPCAALARDVILRRRSALDFDGRTSIGADAFYGMLSLLIPVAERVPWDAIGWSPRIHLALFVHLIDGLRPGLYALIRDPAGLALVRGRMRSEFLWQRPPDCPPGLPLYFLHEADCRRAAARLSLNQAIAGDSAFSLGMLAGMEDSLGEFGAWFYRRLYWEAGMIGQVLYLEAEAAGLRAGNALRATGIGAYFDDPVHDVFGIAGHGLQSIYHFTVGGAVEDTRLTTRPPYAPEIASRT